ncbi:hypothetical protein KVP62_24605, partial [Salmonella sp. LSP 196/10]
MNENTNGLVRQYCPKGSSFEHVDDDYTEMIMERLNNRPRKTLGMKTPVEALLEKGTVAKLAMRQPFVLFKGLTFQKLCLPGAFRP